MSGRLRFEVWTVPTAATFTRLADNLPVLPGGVGTVVMSDYADANIAVPLDATELPLVAAGALITVLDGTTIVDEFFAERVSKEIDRQGTPYASISGPGINGGLAKIAIYPYSLPNQIDWIWGSERNLLNNGGAEDNPLGVLNPGFEDGTRAPWWPGLLEGVSGTLTVDGTTPRTGSFSALVTALILDGGMSTGVKVYPNKEYTFRLWARTPSGSHAWQLGASGPANVVPGAGATLVEAFGSGQFAPGHKFEVQRNTTFGTTYAQADALVFTAGPDQTSSQLNVRYPGASSPQSLRVDDITFTGFGVGVDPWEFTAGVTAFNASQAVAPFEGAWHFAFTAPSSEGVFQGVGNFLPGEVVTLNVAVRGAAATAVSIELRDVRGTVLGQTWGTMATGSWTTLSLTATLPDFIPGPDGEVQVWIVNRHSASATVYFEAEGAGLGLIHGFPAATATEILRLLMEAAYARGTALWLDISSFSDTLDSDGVALPLCPAFQTGPPQTMAHVARNLAELENGIEWTIVRKATPSGTFTHDLKVYIKGGLGSVITDGSKAVIGAHAGTSIGRLRAFTAAGALGDDGLWAEGTDAPGVAAVGRWEKPFDVPHLRSTDALTDFLDDAFADDEINRTAIQAQVRGDAQSVPLLDYRPGDTLPWIVPPYSTASRRVVTISWRHDDLAMYDVTGSKVFPAESATNKAIEILWDEVFHRRVSRPNTTITRPPSVPIPLPGGHPWWILATLGSSAEDRAIANVICDGVADNVDILDGLINHRNVWLCDSGTVDYRIDAVMDLGTDPGNMVLAGEPGATVRLRDGTEGGPYNGNFFIYQGGGSPSTNKMLWIYGVTFDSNQQSAGVLLNFGSLNIFPFVYLDHCIFYRFDTFVIEYSRLVRWGIEQCLFADCQPSAFISIGSFVSNTAYLINSVFDGACTGNMTDAGVGGGGELFIAHNQLENVVENAGTGIIYSHNFHGQTHSPGDHTGITGIDHDDLAGLGDDDHTQYLLVAGTRKATLLDVDGITGATSDSRYVGATASGAPSSGTFAVGDYVIDRSGSIWICTTAGSPGTWTEVGAAAATDSDAIHDNVADEIHQITEKPAPDDADVLLLESSTNSWAKRRVTISNLGAGGGGGAGDILASTEDMTLASWTSVKHGTPKGSWAADGLGGWTWTFSANAGTEMDVLALSKSLSVGATIDAAFQRVGPSLMGGVVGFAAGTTFGGTDDVVAAWLHTGTSDLTVLLNDWDGFDQRTSDGTIVGFAAPRPNEYFWVRCKFEATNTWGLYTSLDGTNWMTHQTNYARTMTPTHIIVGVGIQGNNPPGQVRVRSVRYTA